MVCEFPEWIGDGYCDDATNSFQCQYDGGDCCGPEPELDLCTVCFCFTNENTNSLETSTSVPSGTFRT